MKKLLSILLAVLMVATLGVVNVLADENEQLVNSVQTVEELRTKLEDGSISEINIVSDIDFEGEEWNPIKIERDLVINGNNHTIKNLKVDRNYQGPNGTGIPGDGGSCDYYTGWISDNNAILTINDLNFESAYIDCNPLSTEKSSTGSSILAVVVANNSGTLTYNNVNVYNSTVVGYTKVGILHGFTQNGSFTANTCAVENCSVILEADGTDKEAAFSGVLIGYDGGNLAKTNGIKMSQNTISIDDSVNWGDSYPLATLDDGTVVAGSWGLTSPTYAKGSYGKDTVKFVAEVDGYLYETFYDALDAADYDSSLRLLDNLYVSETIEIKKDVTIDLNGHTIAGDKVRAIKVAKGSLNLSGTGIVTSNVQDVRDSVIRVGDNVGNDSATLVIGENVQITTSTAYGITVFGTTKETVIVNGKVTSSAPSNASYDGCAISTVGDDVTAAEIIINDGAIITDAYANGIYMPSGNLTVNGGEISGLTGIYVKSGKTVITGGEIRGTGEKTEYRYYGNGGISTGDAVVVDNCGYPNGAPVVSIEGGIFRSANAKTVGSYNTEDQQKVLNFINGGSFSAKEPDKELVVDGKYAFVTSDNWYTVLTDPDKVSVLFDYSAVEKDFDLALGNFAWQNFTFTRDGKELGHHYVTYAVEGDALAVSENGSLVFTGKTGLVKVTATCGSKSASAYVYIVDSYETADEGAASSDEDNTSSTLNTESSAVIKSIVNDDSKAFEAKASLVDGVTYEELKNDILSGKTVETVLDSNKVDTISNETTNAAVAAAESQLGGGAKVAGSYDIQVKLIVDGKQKANITSLDSAIQLQIELPEEVTTVPSGYSREVAIVRLHDGVATVIAKGNVSDLGSTITCSSNLFSEYVLVYRDTLDYVYTKPAAKKPVVNTSVR